MTQSPIKNCPKCGCDELFIRKDFPQKLGMAIVVCAAIAFIILAAWRQMFWIGATVLAVAAGVDAILYAIVPKLTVCYRCRGEFRGPINPQHGNYDLAVGEKYRHQPPQL